MRYKETFAQKFEVRTINVRLAYDDKEIEVIPEGMSKRAMRELANELVYSGYSEGAEVEGDRIYLTSPDDGMCSLYSLKEAISGKLEEMNFNPVFLS